MPSQGLKKVSTSKVTLFKVINRRGYAAICLNHLTEGDEPSEAVDRLKKALKRSGYELNGALPQISK